MFFPPLPETPRLQFLKSFSGPEELGTATASGFEKFVLGAPEAEQGISKPYGIAIHDGKLYVCDVGRRLVEVLDLKNRTFGYLTEDRRLTNPVNIHITDDGTKYVADPTAGAVLVFDRNDDLNAILGKELGIAPIDVTVRGQQCYVSDFNSNQIVVFNRNTQQEIARIGEEGAAQPIGETPVSELPPGQILLISDLTLDQQGNIYLSDKAAARITKFDESGKLQRVIGRLGDNVDEFVRPKGIAVDRNQRVWVVDAASEVAKIYDEQARLLLFFGLGGNKPGMMNLPATIVVESALAQNGPANVLRGKQLTNMEMTVLCLILQDRDNDEIADILQRPTSTVESHRSDIMCKLDVNSAVDLERRASAMGLDKTS